MLLAKIKLEVQFSSRTIQRYMNSLGWVKIKTRFCLVSHIQRIHRFFLLNTFFKS
jgi:hypothetical protein